MAINKVIYDGKTLIDISEDTVTSETLAEGVTAHNAQGEEITGTMKVGSDDRDLVKTLLEIRTKEITVPDYITEIKPGAFSGDTTLEKIIAPEVVRLYDEEFLDEEDGEIFTNILPSDAFRNCTSLKSFDMPKLTYVGEGAFANCGFETISIPESITYLGAYCFESCESLISAALPSGLKGIEMGTFSCCYNLQNIVLPNSIEYIGFLAFSSCESLVTIEIPAGVKEIEDRAFVWCYSLETVTFKGKPDTVHANTFGFEEDEASVQTINVPWAEGEVPGAPWGAYNATINYNCTV